MIWKIIPLIIWVIFTIATAYYDAKFNKNIRHWLNAIYRCVFFGALVLVFHIYGAPLMLAFALWAFFFYWFAFNLLYNYWTKQKWYHLGNAWLDRMEASVGRPAIFWKFIAMGFFLAAYFVSL